MTMKGVKYIIIFEGRKIIESLFLLAFNRAKKLKNVRDLTNQFSLMKYQKWQSLYICNEIYYYSRKINLRLLWILSPSHYTF